MSAAIPSASTIAGKRGKIFRNLHPSAVTRRDDCCAAERAVADVAL